jgi:hypothetical protein
VETLAVGLVGESLLPRTNDSGKSPPVSVGSFIIASLRTPVDQVAGLSHDRSTSQAYGLQSLRQTFDRLLEGSRIPAQKRARGDQMLKMFPQLGRHIATHEQDTQLKIAEEGIVSKIGT